MSAARRGARLVLPPVLILFLGLWIAAGALPWWSARRAEAVAQGNVSLATGSRCLWEDLPNRVAGRQRLLEGFSAHLAEADALLACSARARPLYAPTWIARAELAIRQGHLDQADRFIELSTALWPNRARLSWRAAVLRTEMADRDGAFEELRRYLELTGPEKAVPVVRVAERLEPRPRALLARLLPVGSMATADRDEILRRLLHLALRRHDVVLAEAAWSALPEEAQARREIVDLYVESLLVDGDPGRALGIWQRFANRDGRPHSITNGGFEQDPGQRGFGWRIQRIPGTDWSRDQSIRHGGDHSLRIYFETPQDLVFAHASQRLAVRSGGAYRLSGYWRATRITTGSGLYLEAAPHGGRRLAALPARTGSWAWEPFALEFQVPSDAAGVVLRVRRDREKLGRGFSGTLWLDDLTIVGLPEGAAHG